ncbi:hypothetical protein R3P38DRAFT_3459223 [Favolaschia claudopus]|uniref:Uncharacterized protein n=1 Tax=Favolaschia claudopus TaxID=2862362 RepID=A0AAV9ZIE9_9AGAR
MIFKPFLLLASALAMLQIAQGAALAERATRLCCKSVVKAPVPPFLLKLITDELMAAGVTLNPALSTGTGCYTRTGGNCLLYTALTFELPDIIFRKAMVSCSSFCETDSESRLNEPVDRRRGLKRSD